MCAYRAYIIHRNIDSELKKDAVALFREFGLDLSTAISLFLTQSVREQRIPFEITREVPNRNYREVEKMEHNRSKSETFDSVDTLIEDLLK